MTSHKQVVYQSQLDHKSKLLLRRRTRKRFNPRIFIDRIIETTAILSLLFTGFAGVGATGCWGIEIATSSQYWQHLNSKIELLEQHHQDYLQSQQELIPEIAQNCTSFIQEIHALRLLIHRGAGECRKYLLTLQVNRSQASRSNIKRSHLNAIAQRLLMRKHYAEEPFFAAGLESGASSSKFL